MVLISVFLQARNRNSSSSSAAKRSSQRVKGVSFIFSASITNANRCIHQAHVAAQLETSIEQELLVFLFIASCHPETSLTSVTLMV